ncbi:MAG: hypothetical protein WAU88_15565 [Candidatus Zixiibacteriota bacterium]
MTFLTQILKKLVGIFDVSGAQHLYLRTAMPPGFPIWQLFSAASNFSEIDRSKPLRSKVSDEKWNVVVFALGLGDDNGLYPSPPPTPLEAHPLSQVWWEVPQHSLYVIGFWSKSAEFLRLSVERRSIAAAVGFTGELFVNLESDRSVEWWQGFFHGLMRLIARTDQVDDKLYSQLMCYYDDAIKNCSKEESKNFGGSGIYLRQIALVNQQSQLRLISPQY